MNKDFLKRFVLIVVVIAALIALAAWLTKRKPRTIAIVSIVKIEPITQLEEGFKKRINESEFASKQSIRFTYDNAQNDASLQNQIVDKITQARPDLVYVLGTPIATAIQKRDPSLIIVQGAVTDPIEAGLAVSWDRSGKKYAATTDKPPVDRQIALIKQMVPNIRSLGLVYNTSESNSVAVVKQLRAYIDRMKLGIKLEERPVANTSEVSTATESLNGKVQAIYVPPDNTVHAAMAVLCKVANDHKIPVFTSTEDSIKEGAFAALALDYFKLGEQSADIALTILEGKAKAEDIPIKPTENPKIIINQKVGSALGIDMRNIGDSVEVRNE
jgi:putative tryptophan/tyrosine transport system substrate-binding protein